jgi:hypothetical protein
MRYSRIMNPGLILPLRCERCDKPITEHTVRIHRGRCVPCHGKRASQRIRRLLPAVGFFLALPFTVPFDILRGLAGQVVLWLTPLPFTRREVLQIMEPALGRWAARQYFLGLRSGFISGSGGCFGPNPYYADGIGDGSTIKHDSSQWPKVVRCRARDRLGSV